MEQQNSYAAMVKKVKQELETARRTLTELNKQAAAAEGDTATEAAPPTEPEEPVADVEAQELVSQVQGLLHSCAKAVCKEEVMDVSDQEEAPTGAPAKRQRSMEPFGEPPPS